MTLEEDSPADLQQQYLEVVTIDIPQWVIVSVADNGVMHVWGHGKVTGGYAFSDKEEAQAALREHRRDERRRKNEGGKGKVKYHLKPILGRQSVPVKLEDASMPHPFEQEFSAESPFCGALILRDGAGETCGLTADHAIHQI